MTFLSYRWETADWDLSMQLAFLAPCNCRCTKRRTVVIALRFLVHHRFLLSKRFHRNWLLVSSCIYCYYYPLCVSRVWVTWRDMSRKRRIQSVIAKTAPLRLCGWESSVIENTFACTKKAVGLCIGGTWRRSKLVVWPQRNIRNVNAWSVFILW